MDKILIIGDSFVPIPSKADLPTKYPNEFWTGLIFDNYKNYNVIVDGQSSRDIQTIIDKWIISLPKLSEEDVLIICVPTFYRTRLPLKKSKWFEYNNRDYSYINKFIGANQYQEGDESIDTFYGLNINLKLDMITMYQVLNSTESAITNYIDVINSLVSISPCQTYLFSWDTINYKNHPIEDKNTLIENIKEWETLADLYEQSNGEIGVMGDFHWSERMHKLFYDYLVNNKLKNILK